MLCDEVHCAEMQGTLSGSSAAPERGLFNFPQMAGGCKTAKNIQKGKIMSKSMMCAYDALRKKDLLEAVAHVVHNIMWAALGVALLIVNTTGYCFSIAVLAAIGIAGLYVTLRISARLYGRRIRRLGFSEVGLEFGKWL